MIAMASLEAREARLLAPLEATEERLVGPVQPGQYVLEEVAMNGRVLRELSAEVFQLGLLLIARD
jgi:hypothetical protein